MSLIHIFEPKGIRRILLSVFWLEKKKYIEIQLVSIHIYRKNNRISIAILIVTYTEGVGDMNPYL